MKLGIIVYSNDPETIWNAFRLGVQAKEMQDEVSLFLLGKGVEAEDLDKEDFKINEYISLLTEKGGRVFACSTCLKLRNNKQLTSRIQIGTLVHLYEIVRSCDKVVSF